jgi:hypothetical protein
MPAEQAARLAAKLPFVTAMDHLPTVIELSNSLNCILGPRVLLSWAAGPVPLTCCSFLTCPWVPHLGIPTTYGTCQGYVFESVCLYWISPATLLRAVTRQTRASADLYPTIPCLHFAQEKPQNVFHKPCTCHLAAFSKCHAPGARRAPRHLYIRRQTHASNARAYHAASQLMLSICVCGKVKLNWKASYSKDGHAPECV